jgi:hypothetical protein
MTNVFANAALQADSPEGIQSALELAKSLDDVLLIAPMTLMYPDQEVQDKVMYKAVDLIETEDEVLRVRHMASDVLGIPHSSFIEATGWPKNLIWKFAAIRLGKPVSELQR